MELWIRTQDKEKLLKVNDIAIEMNMIYGYFDKNTEYEHLGSYATKERALEVLDEIQTTIRNKYAISLNPTAVIASMPLEKVYEELNQVAVYEMPKD